MNLLNMLFTSVSLLIYSPKLVEILKWALAGEGIERFKSQRTRESAVMW